MKDQKAQKLFWKMFAFQYKPVERELLANISPEQKKIYINFSIGKKIALLDRIAQQKGL